MTIKLVTLIFNNTVFLHFRIIWEQLFFLILPKKGFFICIHLRIFLLKISFSLLNFVFFDEHFDLNDPLPDSFFHRLFEIDCLSSVEPHFSNELLKLILIVPWCECESMYRTIWQFNYNFEWFHLLFCLYKKYC